MRGLFRRKPVTGKHALGAAVTAIPSAPLRGPVAAPTPVVTWEDWQSVTSTPSPSSTPPPWSASGVVGAPDPVASPEYAVAPPLSPPVPVTVSPDWVAPTAAGHDLSAQEVADLVAIAPMVAPDLLSEIAALLATGEAWATAEIPPAAVHPPVSAAVPSRGQSAAAAAAAAAPVSASPVPAMPTASIPALPATPVPVLPTAAIPVLPVAPPELGSAFTGPVSVPVLPTAPPVEAGHPLIDGDEAPAPWTYAVLGVVPSSPEPAVPLWPAASDPVAVPPAAVAAPAVTPPAPFTPHAAVVVPAPVAASAAPPPAVILPVLAPGAPPAAVAPSDAPPAPVAAAPVPAEHPAVQAPPTPAPTSRSALEAALAELLPQQPGAEAPALSPPPAAPAPARVQLGFRDGTSTSLDPASDQSQALQELARSLTRRD